MNKKTIWITGGSTGIGKALAIKFANEGWNVAISARRENLLKEISNNNENLSVHKTLTEKQTDTVTQIVFIYVFFLSVSTFTERNLCPRASPTLPQIISNHKQC